jgi:hypothetical protein
MTWNLVTNLLTTYAREGDIVPTKWIGARLWYYHIINSVVDKKCETPLLTTNTIPLCHSKLETNLAEVLQLCKFSDQTVTYLSWESKGICFVLFAWIFQTVSVPDCTLLLCGSNNPWSQKYPREWLPWRPGYECGQSFHMPSGWAIFAMMRDFLFKFSNPQTQHKIEKS